MRIIGGRFRGHVLAPVPRRGVRPTADPVREALFNILGDSIVGRPFLDLCAGTGAVGIEAYSRGARPVVLVERTRSALKTIEKNLTRLGIAETPEEFQVVASDVGAWLQSPFPRPGASPAVVYLDPPYEERRIGTWLRRLLEGDLLDEETLVIVEHRSGKGPECGRFEPLWTRRYGDSTLAACRLRSNVEESD